jgi:hypothetical protein
MKSSKSMGLAGTGLAGTGLAGTMRHLLIVAAAAVAVAACAQNVSTPAPSEVLPPETLDAARGAGAELAAIDSDEKLIATRWARRLQIDRLQATLPRVAGKDENGQPIRWLVNGKDGLSDAVFGIVLGRPDYVTRTEENPAPSSLYLKFMRDMARDVCTKMVAADMTRDESVEHTLWRFAPVDGTATDAQITENLQYLLLRFLGMKVDASHELVVDYRTVFDAGISSMGLETSSTKAQAEGWRGVCIGLFESPLFHID